MWGRPLAALFQDQLNSQGSKNKEQKTGLSSFQVCKALVVLVPASGTSTSLLRPTGLTPKNRSYYSGHIGKEAWMRKIAAAQFKAQCLAVMDQVSQSGRSVVITKHGKPVVKVVPANEGEDEIFGALAGIARITGDIENTVPARDWGAE
jgi:prevent-host-death family protein